MVNSIKKKKYIKIVFLGVVFITTLFGLKILKKNTEINIVENNVQPKYFITSEINYLNMQKSIDLGENWLRNYQKKDGLFNYIYYPKGGTFSNDNDNDIVRQIGTFYGLIRIYEFNGKKEETLEAIEKFRTRIQDFIKYDNIENKEIAYIEYGGIPLINSQAMYILAMSELYKNGFYLTNKERNDMKKMLEGIYLMENPKGGLWYIYYVPEENNKITPYGTGETLFALVSYYKYIEPDDKALNFAKKHFDLYYEISKKYSFPNEQSRAFYAWVLYYLSEIDSIESGHFPQIKYLLEKALEYRNNNPQCKNNGCIMTQYNVGESSFLEGASSVYKIVEKNDKELAENLKKYFTKSVEMLLETQLTDDEYDFGLKMNIVGDKDIYLGGFCTSLKCEYIRNDFAQHVLLGFVNILNNNKIFPN